MTLTLNLSPELEEQIRGEAQRAGVEPATFVLGVLSGHLGDSNPTQLTETELLVQISQGLPASDWERYHELIAQRDMNTLDASDLQELGDRVETTHARRMQFVVELATRRGVGLNG